MESRREGCIRNSVIRKGPRGRRNRLFPEKRRDYPLLYLYLYILAYNFFIVKKISFLDPSETDEARRHSLKNAAKNDGIPPKYGLNGLALI